MFGERNHSISMYRLVCLATATDMHDTCSNHGPDQSRLFIGCGRWSRGRGFGGPASALQIKTSSNIAGPCTGVPGLLGSASRSGKERPTVSKAIHTVGSCCGLWTAVWAQTVCHSPGKTRVPHVLPPLGRSRRATTGTSVGSTMVLVRSLLSFSGLLWPW